IYCTYIHQLLLQLHAYMPHFLLFNTPAPPKIYTLSLHDALPIWYLDALSTYTRRRMTQAAKADVDDVLYVPAALALHQRPAVPRSEEHTSELQSRFDLVCRLLLEKKKKYILTHLESTYYYHNTTN